MPVKTDATNPRFELARLEELANKAVAAIRESGDRAGAEQALLKVDRAFQDAIRYARRQGFEEDADRLEKQLGEIQLPI